MENPNITTELKSHFLRLYQMAFSDDNFDVLELQMLYRFAEERGVSTNELNEILQNPSHGTSLPETLEDRIDYLYDLAIMIWADNIVTKDEENTLKKYCIKFGFLEENVQELSDFLLERAKENISKQELIKEITNAI
ncbi:hypothetical protein [Winogradskyella sp. 3972H.M.0a.05]|uniref:hypothetical protein n=1 Tax=Winogradskyella sp. 3972H.M.0a.05 TaxID=2950277 RepID=UPI0033938428